MIQGPPVYHHECYVPVDGAGFSGFVSVHVDLDWRTDDHTADVREAAGVVETPTGTQPVSYDGCDVPEQVARDAEQLAIAQAMAEYEMEAEEERFFYERHMGAA